MSKHDRWMEDMQEQLGNRSLREIVIPGTHDSGAFDFASIPDPSPDASIVVDVISAVSFVARVTVVKAWAQTQNRNFKEQLEDGIRYFDLRIACDGSPKYGNMRCVHSIWAAHLSQLTDAIKDFIQARRKEIIILDFNHFYKMSPEKFTALAEGLKQALGSALVPRSQCLTQVDGEYRLDLSVKLNGIWNGGHQVIVIFDGKNQGDANPAIDLNAAPFDAFWPSSAIVSSDYCEINKFEGDGYKDPHDKLKGEQGGWLKKANKKHAEQLYVFQGIVSPSGDYIRSNLTSSVKSACADHVTKQHFEALLNDWRNNAGVNIAIVDFYNEYKTGDGKGYLDVVRELNQR